MTRIETLTFEYEHCSECPNILDWFDTGKRGDRCEKAKRGRGYRIIKDMSGEIPKWCPLEKKDLTKPTL